MEHTFHKLIILETEQYGDVYSKADVDLVIGARDKVIEDLEKERNWLAKDRALAYRDLEKRAQLNIKQEESIRHQKYKRCVAMARWCDTKADWYYGIGRAFRSRVDFFIKWQKRWLELADVFK